ncbi:MAG: DUF4097 domain-containing protein, partial [Pseudomonadales bacterium]
MKLFMYVAIVLMLSSHPTIGAENEHVKQQTIEHSFPAQPGSRVVIDGINGSIRVHGYSGNEVRVVVQEEMRGHSESDLQQALEDIVLQIKSDEDEINFYVHTPWRDCHRKCSRSHNHDYEFSHDFELQVPYGVALYLRTVNGGDIRVDDVRGVVELNNVNGRIDAIGILGISKVRTVNGGIVLEFMKVPRQGGEVVTVNGDVDLAFPSIPDAHVSMKTMNGGLYSDFAYTHKNSKAQIESRTLDGRYVYRSSGGTEISIGKGGPVWSLETLNGDIYIRKDDR